MLLTTTNFFDNDELTMHDEISRRRGAFGQISRQAAGEGLGAGGRKGRGPAGVSPRWTTRSICGKRGIRVPWAQQHNVCVIPAARNPPFGGRRNRTCPDFSMLQLGISITVQDWGLPFRC